MARLARTCKLLFEFAHESLWETISSLSAFICCLPADYRTRPLKVQDLQRLDFYSTKVRSLVLDPPWPEVIHLPQEFKDIKRNKYKNSQKSWASLWKEISSLRPNWQFLPNLYRLQIGNVVENLLIPLVGVSGLNLTQIHINCLHDKLWSESLVFEVLDGFQDTPKLVDLLIKDGDPDMVPAKLITQSPLNNLQLGPRSRRNWSDDSEPSPLLFEILQKSTLKHLTLALSQALNNLETEVLESKYLPALKTLRLNMTSYNGRMFPIFLRGLDDPDLSVLSINFPSHVSDLVCLEVVRAVNSSCRLGNLTRLTLAGGQFHYHCGKCGYNANPKITPPVLREALTTFLPMPRLRTLHINVAPNFLDILDLDLYAAITAGLPALETLWLGHYGFVSSELEGRRGAYYERVPLQHLAAFCHLLPNLVDVSLGAADGLSLEEHPREDWASPSVESLRIHRWAGDRGNGRRISRDLLHLGLRTYFPNSDLAQKDFSSTTVLI